jgi:DNA-directed RNA polymerase specialized sigma24 family protein
VLEVLWSFRPRLRRLVRRFGVPERDAEDVVQEAMLGAWRSIVDGRWQPAEYSAALLWRWLTAIAFRQARNETRRPHHRLLLAPERVDAAWLVGDAERVLDARRDLLTLTEGGVPLGDTKDLEVVRRAERMAGTIRKQLVGLSRRTSEAVLRDQIRDALSLTEQLLDKLATISAIVLAQGRH